MAKRRLFDTVIKASAIRGALAPWRYERSVNRWVGGRARAFREFIADQVVVTAGESVLDLGCGTGELGLILRRRVGPDGRVAGVDLAKNMVAGAQRKAKRAGLALDYRVASVAHLPFADASVDLVVSSLVLHHLAPDVLATAVREIRRVLKPGGRVCVIDFQSLDQAGQGAHQPAHAAHGDHGHQHRHGHGHGHGHMQDPKRPMLHDHQQTLVGLLQEAGLADAHAIHTEFGQRLEITRGQLPPAKPGALPVQ